MNNERMENEGFFKNIFEFHTAVQLIIEPVSGNIIDANRAAENYYGWSKEQLRQMRIGDINTLSPKELKQAMLNAKKRKQNHFEFKHRLANNTIRDVEVFSCDIIIKGEKLLHSIIHDITNRKQAEESLKLDENRLESLLKINQYPAKTIQELLDFALEEAIYLTRSQIGYIYFYDEGKKEFTLNSWSKEVMHQCTITEPQTIYELDKTGIWGEAVRQRKPILINDFDATNPLKKGVTDGHAPLHKFLTIPVFSKGKIVAVVGVANKNTDYVESDVRQLNLMMDAVWKVVQRLKSEEIIKQSEARLRRAELASKSGNWELHLETRLMYASEGAMELYGVKHSINQFDEIQNFPLIEYREMLNIAFDGLINNDQPYNVEFKIERLTDKKILDIHSLAKYDKEKKIIFGTIQDISERKLAEEALKESEEKFRALFTQMVEGFALHEVIYDETQTAIDYRVVDVNPAFEKQLGLSVDKAIGVLASQLYGTSPAPFLEVYAQVAKTGKHHVFENYISSMDRYFDISVFSPKQGYFATIFSDITESKRSEEKLKEEQLFNKTLIENLPGIFYIYSYPDLQLVSWNKNMETMFGFNSEELKNRFSVDWPQPEVKKNLNIAMHTVYNEGYVQMEVSLYRKDGIKIPVLLSAVRFDAKDQTYIMGYGIDITLRRKAYEALRESELQLLELNATKDKFFSIIAHDLKSPFNSILGLSNLLIEQIQANNFDGIEEYADIIQNSSKRAMDLLLNLLEWSRSQTGRMEYNPEYIELGSIIDEVIDLLDEAAQQKGICVTKDLPKKMIAYADKDMISTIMRNLLSNAIKFTNIDGCIRIVLEKKRGELLISVIDNGVGIAPGNIKKLFRLEENHTTLGTKNEKGTGLGLVLCKEFVEKHQGRIGVESNIDDLMHKKGSKFYFTLPVV